MKTLSTLLASLVVVVMMGATAWGQFTSGNLVVVQIGDGSAALTTASTPISLLEFTPTGTPGITVSIPSTGSSPRLTVTGTSTSEGHLVRSSDGNYITVVGYDTVAGVGAGLFAVAGVRRVIARLNSSAAVDLTTEYTDGGTNAVRSAASDDGSNTWTAANANNVRYKSFGTTGTSTQLSTTVTNMRVVKIFNGQLYVTSSSGAFLGVSTIGTGTPTTSGQTTTALPGMPTTGTHSAYSFSISPDGNTLYLADDGTAAAGGGIQKWTLSAGTWSLAYTLLNNGTTTTGTRGLTVDWSGANPVIYATTNVGAPSSTLIKVIDTGSGSTATTLATAPANTVFRGVDFAPGAPPSCTTPGASATGGTLTCTITSVALSAASDQGGVSFSWAGPGIVSGGTTANPLVSSEGTYTVTVTASSGGCTNTATALVNTNTTEPGASATGGTLTCASSTTVLSAASTSSIIFSWSGPGTITNGGTANPTVNATGTYTVTVLNSSNGCTSTATASVNSNTEAPGASATGGSLTCASSTTVLSAATSSGTGFSWAGPGSITNGNTANPTVNAVGTYTVTVTNSANGCTSTATASVTTNATLPGASATGGTLTCTTTSVVLSAATTSGTGFSWAGPGIVSGGTTANPRVSAAGTYTVTVTNSATGCNSQATALVTLNNTAPGASATGGTLTCATTSVVLSAATTSGTGFSWAGTGIVSGGTTANPTVSSAGTYTVTVTNSANGCTSTATASVNINNTPPGASATGGIITCTATSVVLSASSTSGTGFSWAGSGIVSGGTTANPRVSSAGTFTVTVTNSSNGCTSTATASVTANTTAPGASATGGSLTCASSTTVLSAATTSGTAFSWAGPGTIVNGGTANPTVNAGGTYTVTVTNSANGCTSTATAEVTSSGALPGASATGGTLTCTTTSVVLSAATTSGTGFSWAGPGIVSGGTTANPRVSAAGTYTVTVTNSATGCNSQATALVNANVAPPGASATGGTITCTVTSVILSAATTSGNSFSWAGAGILSGGSTANATVSGCGVTYTLTVTNSANGCTSTATVLVNCNTTPPGASATGGSLTCATTSVVLSAATTSGTSFSWAGAGIVSGGTTANPRVSSAGTYTVTVTNSANGCTSTATALVSSTAGTPPGASATGGSLTCSVTSVVLSAATTSGTGFSWAGPGIVSGGTTANPTVSATGTYTVTVGSSATGCSSTATASVNQTGTPPGASATGGSLTCTTTSVVLSAAGGGTGFSWAGPGIVSGGTTANPTVSATGTYTVTVTNTATACTSTATATVANGRIAPTCTLVAPVPLPVCGSIGNVLAPSPIANANTFLWSLNGTGWTLDSPPDSTAARYSTGSGSCTFKLVVTNTTSGCKDSCTVSFECDGEQEFFCSLTQGAYGNANGRWCDGLRRLALIGQLLDGTPLVLGKTGRSLTIVRADSQCVIDKLPAGGQSDMLPAADYTFTALCGFSTTSPSMPVKNGRFHNNMIGQTLTLGLNLRLGSGNLGSLILGGPFMTTLASTGCTEGATPIPGTETTVSIPQSVLDALISIYGTPSVANLFDLANSALGGQSTGDANLNQIHSAVGAINAAFDECRFLVGFSSSPPSVSRLIIIDTSEELPTEYALALNYPNPFNPSTTVEYAIPQPSSVTLKVYNMLGQEVATLVSEVMEAGYHSITWSASSGNGAALASGVYVCRMRATSITTGKEFTRTRKMLLLK